MDKTLGAVQPSYLAWVPFFQRMVLSDVFVYLDDVEFSKNSPHNKNKIKTPNGSLSLAVPIKYSGNSSCNISHMPIENKIPWQKKHWKSIQMNYSKTPYYHDFGNLLYTRIYSKEWEFLGKLNIEILELIRKYLSIPTTCVTSSTLNINLKNNDKLVEMCKLLGANKFLVKPGTNNYHPKDFFEKNEISLNYFNFQHFKYSQHYGEFVSGLSIIDLIFNHGPLNTKKFLTEIQ